MRFFGTLTTYSPIIQAKDLKEKDMLKGIFDGPLEDFLTILEAFPDVIQEYDVILALTAIIIVVILAIIKLVIAWSQAVPQNAVDKVREIATLPNEEIEELKRKNERTVVAMLVADAQWTINVWDNRNRHSERDVREAKNSFGILAERYEAIKKGKVFSQYNPGKRNG